MTPRPPSPAGAHLLPRAVVLFGFAVLFSLAAIVARNPVPLFAAVPLLLAPLAAASARPVGIEPVRLVWEATGLGSELVVQGTVSGPFGGAADAITIEPPSVAGATISAPPEVARTPTEIRFTFRWTLGEPAITVLPPPRIAWRDPLGLLEHGLAGELPPLPVERYPPELHRLRNLQLDRTLDLPGEARSRRLGASGEFFGIRDAAPDEPPRRINWMASARAGRLLANDFLIDRTGDILLLLDVRPTGMGPVVDERILGVARAGMFGIADALLRTKVRVGFAAFGEFVTAAPLSTGRVHRIRLQHALADAARSDVAAMPDRCVHGLRRYFRPGLTTLVMSAWAGDTSGELMPYLRRAGFPAFLVSPNPLSLDRPERGREPSPRDVVVERLEQAERRARLGSLWEYGAVIDWSDYWSLDALVRFLQRPARRRVS